MTTNTWTGATSQWWDVASNWSLGHAPTQTEDVVLVGSGTVSFGDGDTHASSAECQSLDASTFTGTLTGHDVSIYVHGNLTFSASMQYTGQRSINLVGSVAVTSAGHSFQGLFFNSGGTLTLNDNLTLDDSGQGFAFYGATTINLGTHVLAFQGCHLGLFAATTWHWSAGGKLTFASTVDATAGIYHFDAGVTMTPSLPPVEVDASIGVGTGQTVELVNQSIVVWRWTIVAGGDRIAYNGATVTELHPGPDVTGPSGCIMLI